MLAGSDPQSCLITPYIYEHVACHDISCSWCAYEAKLRWDCPEVVVDIYIYI